MTPAEALGVAVQVAVAIAGFAGVVVAFRTEAVHRWSATDQFRLRLLLGNSVIPLIVSLFGMFMLAIEPQPSGIWRWCSTFNLLIMLPYGIYLGRRTRRIPRTEFPSDAFTRWVFYPLGMMAWLFTFLQVYNVIFLGAFWPLFGLIVFQLFAATIQFVRLILLAHPD